MANIKFLQYFSLLRYRAIYKLLKNSNIQLILDMEDSAQNLFSRAKTLLLKNNCRQGVSYLSENSVNLENCFIRINSTNSDFFDEDIKILKKKKT